MELLKLIAHYTACYNFQYKLLNSEKNSHDRAGHEVAGYMHEIGEFSIYNPCC